MAAEGVIILTQAQLKEFAYELAAEILKAHEAAQEAQLEAADQRRYVYGIRGIRDLFNVSHSTAQRYKNTFLAPAVMQRGRKIVVDAAAAIKLYDQHMAV